jgi:M6 family metalloprotease-like protein
MRRIASITTLLAFLFLINTQHLNAIRAYPNPVVITQPDGTLLTIRIHGDEFNHFRTTEDGYMVSQKANGFYTYSNIDLEGNKTETDIIARDIAKRTSKEINFLRSANKPENIKVVIPQRSRALTPDANTKKVQRAYPLIGSPKSLVILVNFSDKSFITTDPEISFDNLLNQAGYSTNGGTGSARDYFMSSSYGKFSPDFDVIGPYTLPQNMAYYGTNDASGYDLKPEYMVIQACEAAEAAGFDFAPYDTDGNNIIDNVFIYYAGNNEAEGAPETTIWPHRWDINSSGYSGNKIFDGKTVNDYACTSELRGATGTNMCGIGTFSHEFGHVIGLPDYYHTTSAKASLETWSIMDYGGYSNIGRTPPAYSAYDRFYLGWLTPQEINTPSDQTLLPLYQGTTQPANTNQQAYLLSASTHNLTGGNPNPKEFFIVEYRKHTGWDTYLGQDKYSIGTNSNIPSDGMLIWHIDYDQIAWYNNGPNNYTGTTQTLSSHMRVYLQPLSGSSTTPGTTFTTGSFIPTTWSGTDINRAITSINKTTDNVTFKLMGGTPVDPNAPAVKLGTIENDIQYASTKVNLPKIKTYNIKTTDLTGNLTLVVSGTNASFFVVSTATLTKEAANSAIGANINVTYTPTTVGTHSAILTISGGGLNPVKVINLTGTSL